MCVFLPGGGGLWRGRVDLVDKAEGLQTASRGPSQALLIRALLAVSERKWVAGSWRRSTLNVALALRAVEASVAQAVDGELGETAGLLSPRLPGVTLQ